MLVTLPALHMIYSQRNLQRSISRLLRACSTKLRRKAKIFTITLSFNTHPHTGSLWSPMQILQGRNARSALPNASRKQLGSQPEIVRNSDKHAELPTHHLHVGQHVMFQDSTTKCWYPAVIKICVLNQEITRDGIVYRKTNLI